MTRPTRPISTIARGWVPPLVLVGLCLWPHAEWCRSPSLFDDDLSRVGSLRRVGGLESLLRPFNEHVAPLFEGVGILAWWGSGERVDAVAGGFLVASLLAAVLAAASLGLVVRLELGSMAPAWVAVGLFTWSTAAAETVLWYSASSFLWAAAASLLAWATATRVGRADQRRARVGWLLLAAVGALAAPSFSAVGILAGPLAAWRLVLAWFGGDDPASRPSHPVACLAPLGGTLLYLGLLALGHGDEAVAASVRRHLDPGAAAWAMLRAPSLVVLPSLVGVAPLVGRLPDAVAVGLTMVAGLAVLIRVARSRRHRAFLGVCLGWIVGGSALVYATRARAGDDWVLLVGRYHLFPLVGVVGIVAEMAGSVPRPSRPLRRVAAVAGLVLLGQLWFVPGWRLAAVPFRFPDQPGIIAAGLRLEAACRAEGVTLDRAIRLIPPTEPRWFPRPLAFHPLLYLFGPDAGPGPTATAPDDESALARLLGHLSPADRAAIFGELDLGRAGLLEAPAAIASGATALRLDPVARGASIEAGEGWQDWLEYEVPDGLGPASGLEIGPSSSRGRFEVWWTDAAGGWSSRRSVRWPTGVGPLAVRFGRLPHGWPTPARRFRLVRRGRPWGRGEGPTLRLLAPPMTTPR